MASNSGLVFAPRSVHIVVGALVAGCLTACSSSRYPPAPVQATSGDYRYLIGPLDVINIIVWRNPDLSMNVAVRPDGKISMPLLKDVAVAGYTPEQLTEVLVKSASKYVSQPNATVIVKSINSRKVFVIGQVGKPGSYPLVRDMTVLQLIADAGDVLEYAKAKDIVVVRKEGTREQRFKFNYRDVLKGKHAEQNILLKPGDTVIVP